MANLIYNPDYWNSDRFGRKDNTIPGKEKTEGRDFIYFQNIKKYTALKNDKKKSFSKHFKVLGNAMPNPLNAKDGAINEEGCRVTLPNGDFFHALLVHGDPEGWIKDIEYAAKALEIPTARVDGDKFIISDGRSFDLKDCQVEFDVA
jgi:hypothetical protein